jgi:ribokinase
MRSPGTVVLLGDINVDVLMTIDAYPEQGGDGMANRLDLQVGGGTINSALSLTRFGVPAIPMVCTGEDAWATFLLDRLAPSGLDVRYICSRPGVTTGLTFIAVSPGGERTMFSYRGANSAFRPEDVDESVLEGAGWLHLSSYALLTEPQRDALWLVADQARQRGIPVSMDLTEEVVVRQPEGVLRILPVLDTCILGHPEVQWLGGEKGFVAGLDRLLQLGIAVTAVKLGSTGCLLTDGTQRMSFPAFNIEAVDTSGAGDAFSAGIVFARMHGLSMPATAALASALGALTASVHGAGLSMPGEQEVLAFLQEQPEQREGVGELIDFLTKDKDIGDGPMSDA